MHLGQIKKGQTAIIDDVSTQCDTVVRLRLLDLGFVPGTEITPQLISPFNDPVAYLIHNTLVSLRQDDSVHILVHLKKE